MAKGTLGEGTAFASRKQSAMRCVPRAECDSVGTAVALVAVRRIDAVRWAIQIRNSQTRSVCSFKNAERSKRSKQSDHDESKWNRTSAIQDSKKEVRS